MARYPSCILATCVIPWDEQYEFQEDLFVHQVEHLLAHGTNRLYIFGTAGEGYAVSERQFERIVRVFHDAMRARQAEPMVGVISLSLATVIERIECAREIGVRQFQLTLPSWGAVSDREMLAFFRETCGRFPDCQFLHYNLLRTKRLVTPAEYKLLAAEHPNLVATKNTADSIDRIVGLLREAPQLQHFLSERGYAVGRQWGECGLLISVAATNWQRAREFFDAGDSHTTMRLADELVGATQCLLDAAGPPHIDGAYDKLLWKLHDPRFPLRLLPPYEGATPEMFDRYVRELGAKFPQWLPS